MGRAGSEVSFLPMRGDEIITYMAKTEVERLGRKWQDLSLMNPRQNKRKLSPT